MDDAVGVRNQSTREDPAGASNHDAENANDDPLLSIDLGDARNDDVISYAGTNDSSLLGVNVEGGIKYSGRLDASFSALSAPTARLGVSTRTPA